MGGKSIGLNIHLGWKLQVFPRYVPILVAFHVEEMWHPLEWAVGCVNGGDNVPLRVETGCLYCVLVFAEYHQFLYQSFVVAVVVEVFVVRLEMVVAIFEEMH